MSERVRPAGAVIGLLAVWNVLINVAVPSWAYVPANLAMVALLLGLARSWGLGPVELALERARFRDGLRLGVIAAAGVAVGLVVLAAWGWSRRFLEDGTLVDLAVVGMLYQVLIRIPFGTAVLEEIAFRGVLYGVLAGNGSARGAAVGSSVVFGLWHVLPALGRLDLNPAGDYAVNGLAEVGLVGLFVILTGLAGLGFAWLRVRSGSLIAPIAAHAGINGSAFLLGWLIAG